MENTPEIPTETPNILDDVEYLYVQASGWKRFANYLVDQLGFYLLWRLFLINVYVWFVLTLHVPTENTFLLLIIAYLTSMVLLGLMIGGFEAATGGKTLGKYLTRTRAVNEDGSRITPKTALLRYLCRLVPFEAFSALGTPSYPWHDRWTKTLVIDETQTTLPPQD